MNLNPYKTKMYYVDRVKYEKEQFFWEDFVISKYILM